MKIKKFLLMSLLTIFLFSCGPAPAQEIQIIEAEQRSITVSGSGEIKVSPDLAEVVFVIYTADKDVTLVKEQNEEISNKVLAVLKKFDIAEKDIIADYLSVFAETPDDSPVIYRYGVKNAFKVTIRNLTELELIITSVLKEGGVRVSSVFVIVSELERYKQQARDKAIQSAKQKARNMVVQFGQEIDLPLSIQETSSLPDSSTFYASLSVGRIDYNNYNPYSSSVVSFREITIRSTVTVTYSLKLQ
jgi:uncharacterized protein